MSMTIGYSIDEALEKDIEQYLFENDDLRVQKFMELYELSDYFFPAKHITINERTLREFFRNKGLSTLFPSELKSIIQNWKIKKRMENARKKKKPKVFTNVQQNLRIITDKEDWDKRCWRKKLNKDLFGKTIILGGKDYKIIGLTKRLSKHCVRIQNDQGKYYTTTADNIIAQFEIPF